MRVAVTFHTPSLRHVHGTAYLKNPVGRSVVV